MQARDDGGETLDTAAILEAVAAEMRVHLDALLGKSRARDVIEARWIAVHALGRCGLSTAAIGRVLCRDHSTIVHGQLRAKEHPAWDSLADAVLTRCNLPGVGLDSRLRHILRGRAPAEHAAVAACVYCTLLHCIARPAAACLHGLLLLARDEHLRHQLQGALWACDYRGAAGSVDRYIAQTRYPRVGAAWRSPEQLAAPLLLPTQAETLLLEENPPVSKVELIDPNAIPARAGVRNRAALLADATTMLRQAHAANKAIKLNLESAERSAPVAAAYKDAAKGMNLRVFCQFDGSIEYTGLKGIKRKDFTTVYVRILGGKLAAVAS